MREPGFVAITPNDGVDFEFDGLSDEMFITIQYSQIATPATGTTAEGCDTLLFFLICRSNPYKFDTEDQEVTRGATVLTEMR